MIFNILICSLFYYDHRRIKYSAIFDSLVSCYLYQKQLISSIRWHSCSLFHRNYWKLVGKSSVIPGDLVLLWIRNDLNQRGSLLNFEKPLAKTRGRIINNISLVNRNRKSYFTGFHAGNHCVAIFSKAPVLHTIRSWNGTDDEIGKRFENLIPSTVLKTPIVAAGWSNSSAPRLVSVSRRYETPMVFHGERRKAKILNHIWLW